MIKEIASVIVLLALCVPGLAVDLPNLVGNWTGFQKGYVAEEGSYKLSENIPISLAIVEQKGRLFTGNFAYPENGTEIIEGFAGAIGSDNRTLYIAENDIGYDMGTIVSGNEIEFIWLQDGKMGGAFINSLHRIK